VKPFDVLKKETSISSPLVLEASAGTGKTFSIEHLVVRSLIEDEIPIDQFLVVTFTKAAAQELKMRIWQNIQRALSALKDGLDETPYIAAILPNADARKAAMQRLRCALVQFDQAYIATIHSFCFRALVEYGEENRFWSRLQDEKEILPSQANWETLAHLLRDCEIMREFSPGQMKVLYRACQYRVLDLAQQVIQLATKGLKIHPPLTNDQLLAQFAGLDSSKWGKRLSELMAEQGHCFKGVCARSSQSLKPEYQEFFEQLSRCLSLKNIDSLDALIDGLGSQKYFSKDNIKSKASLSQEMNECLHFLRTSVYPILMKWGSPSFLIARLASYAEKAIADSYEKSGRVDYTYLLLKMQKEAQKPAFQSALRSRFKKVIIDEFQDTDPIQWAIFKTLFPPSSLVLVGDPKQSIYSFRAADIYTYMDAVQTLGASARHALQTNFRSSKRCIEALNRLFDTQNNPHWMSLPLKKTALPYRPVLYAREKEASGFSDEPVMEFLLVEEDVKQEEIEEKYLFPRFVSEVLRLRKEKNIPLRKIAFLVRDHAQSNRLATFLRSCALPCVQQRSESFSQAAILDDLIYLLRAILNPRSLSSLQAALSTRFFGWDFLDLEKHKEHQDLAQTMQFFHSYKEAWYQDGIFACMQALLASDPSGSGASCEARLMRCSEGRQNFHELEQIIEWMAFQEQNRKSTPEMLIRELEAIASGDQPWRRDLKMRPLNEEEALPILTLHMCKGLEFDIIFALGLMNRPPVDEGIFLARDEKEIVLKAASEEHADYQQFLEECDAEKARQLYVALTRAKEKLFIPIITGWEAPKPGQASPIELFLAHLAYPEAPWKDLYQHLECLDLDPLKTLCEDFSLMRIEKLEQKAPLKDLEQVNPVLNPPPDIHVNWLPQYSISFTSLTKVPMPDAAIGAPRNFDCADLNKHTLPSGGDTGELIHQMLEDAPLDLMSHCQSPSELIPWIQRYTSQTPFQRWNEVLAGMLFNAFALPFEGIRLVDLKEGELFREMEFLFPLHHAQQLSECHGMDGEVKGVIDLAFTFQGKYYLLDWKTNWLGPDDSFYTHQHLEEAMKKHRYHLQAELYQIAFRTYLKALGKSEESFEGTYYMFLRGFDGFHGVYRI
jgi:exodeoxyribonuclease V beta subunit